MLNVLNPEDRLTRVFPTFRVSNMEGALRSYQSEFARFKGQLPGHGLSSTEIRVLTLASEGVYNTLLDTLFAFRKTLVLTDSCLTQERKP